MQLFVSIKFWWVINDDPCISFEFRAWAILGSRIEQISIYAQIVSILPRDFFQNVIKCVTKCAYSGILTHYTATEELDVVH